MLVSQHRPQNVWNDVTKVMFGASMQHLSTLSTARINKG